MVKNDVRCASDSIGVHAKVPTRWIVLAVALPISNNDMACRLREYRVFGQSALPDLMILGRWALQCINNDTGIVL